MAKERTLGTGFTQAPQSLISTGGMTTPSLAGITVHNSQQMSKFLKSFVGGAASVGKTIGSSENADAVSESTEDYGFIQNEIKANDPMWEIEVWAKDKDGNNLGVFKEQDEVVAEIHKALEVNTSGRSQVYTDKYLERMTPGILSALTERGLARRENQIDNMMDDFAISIIGTTDVLGNRDGFVPAIDKAFNDIKSVIPKFAGEEDDDYNKRIKDIYVSKIVPQLLTVWEKTGDMDAIDTILNSGKEAEEGGWQLNAVERAEVLNKANTAWNDRLYKDIQNPTDDNGTLSWSFPEIGDNGKYTGKDKKITSMADLEEYLDHEVMDDPDSIFYLSPTRKKTLLRDFFQKEEVELGYLQVQAKAKGEPVAVDPADHNQINRYLINQGWRDPNTNMITNGIAAANAIGMIGVSSTVSATLWQQLESTDMNLRNQAGQFLVILSQHPNQNAWNDLFTNVDSKTQMALMELQVWGEQHPILTGSTQGNTDYNKDAIDFLSNMVAEGLAQDLDTSTLSTGALAMAKEEVGITIGTEINGIIDDLNYLPTGWFTNDADMFTGNSAHMAHFESVYYSWYTMHQYKHPGATQAMSKEFARNAVKQEIKSNWDVAVIGSGSARKGILVSKPSDMGEHERWNVKDVRTAQETWIELEKELTQNIHKIYIDGVAITDPEVFQTLTPRVSTDNQSWYFIAPGADRLMHIKEPGGPLETFSISLNDLWNKRVVEPAREAAIKERDKMIEKIEQTTAAEEREERQYQPPSRRPDRYESEQATPAGQYPPSVQP